MSRIAPRTGGLLALLLISAAGAPSVSAQSPSDEAATAAADAVEAILQGDDGAPAWDALATALQTSGNGGAADRADGAAGDAAAADPIGVEAGDAAAGANVGSLEARRAEGRAAFIGALEAVRGAALRLTGSSPGGEVLVIVLIVLLGAFALAAVVLGLMRRAVRGRARSAGRTAATGLVTSTRRAASTRRASPATGRARRRARRGAGSAAARRRGGPAACRDAERLEARLRASRAA